MRCSFNNIMIEVLNYPPPVIPEIFYRESNDRPSTQAHVGDDWMIEVIVRSILE